MLEPHAADRMMDLLFALGADIRRAVQAARATATSHADLAGIATVTAADVIYRIDRVSENVILDWFAERWPAEWPVELVMEGLEDRGAVTFPVGTPVSATHWKCIIDPIDGTRNLMFDKRSAWTLAGIAPQRGAETTLGDIVVAAMAELPTTKAWRADDIGAVRGRGPAGIVARARDLRSGTAQPFTLHPSTATNFGHGFASFVRFFPEGKVLTAELEDELWRRVGGENGADYPVVFDDQYISTGGQLYEILSGHDRMIGDLRPVVLPHSGHPTALACHPYDLCSALVLEEAGGIVEAPRGGPVQAPLDTTTPVAWIGYANPTLADLVRPHLRAILDKRAW